MQALFMRFNTLQFALPTGNFVKYFPTKLKLIRRKSITALTYEATKQNIFK